MTQRASVSLHLPEWLLAEEEACAAGAVLTSDTERMRFVIGLARRNVNKRTGGPFAAAVFRSDTGQLVASGVNLVVTGRCSVAHAEVVAIMFAQQRMRTHDLGGPGQPPCELVTSTEPCAMCLGAVPWSGIRRLVCGARGEDAEAIGLDEGAKPADWVPALRQRAIDVVRDVLRAEAAAVLRHYARGGGVIYNGRRATDSK